MNEKNVRQSDMYSLNMIGNKLVSGLKFYNSNLLLSGAAARHEFGSVPMPPVSVFETHLVQV